MSKISILLSCIIVCTMYPMENVTEIPDKNETENAQEPRLSQLQAVVWKYDLTEISDINNQMVMEYAKKHRLSQLQAAIALRNVEWVRKALTEDKESKNEEINKLLLKKVAGDYTEKSIVTEEWSGIQWLILHHIKEQEKLAEIHPAQ